MIGIFSAGIRDIPNLSSFLGEQVIFSPGSTAAGLTKVAGWGLKPTAEKARRFAAKLNLPYVSLEDGFLRSFGLGVMNHPPLSLIVDDTGIYYDATGPSRLENILNFEDLSENALHIEAAGAIELILKFGLSKYNHAPDIDPSIIKDTGREKILVVDQTYGDMSVKKGMADKNSFSAMLDAARSENPDADIYIKTHPDVVAGKKRGYLSNIRPDGSTTVISKDVNPLSLVQKMDRVYVVTSQLGFEALLAGKPVTCFGMPFYGGWGVTDDRVSQPRRSKNRSVQEIFIAAYLKYCRYINPADGKQGTIFDVIDHLIRQKKYAEINKGRFFFFGFRLWKHHYIRSFFQGYGTEIIFAGSMKQAIRRGLGHKDRIVVWGHNEPQGLSEFASAAGIPVWRVEDGFIRSLGLGSDLVRPMSLVLDKKGIYYDARHESDLEHILNTYTFSDDLCSRAEQLRDLIVLGKITKYNTEQLRTPAVHIPADKRVIFVPGQVEDDASIRFGTEDVSTNRQLLEEVRRSNPDAFIIYKPHPDVMARNRKGKVSFEYLRDVCDHAEPDASVISCIELADEVHTMTSLTGFDALLRGKTVAVYGAPFYAGWGLTEDRMSFPRRQRRLLLNELIAGALIIYPRYFDWDTKNFVECETIAGKIVRQRQRLEAEGRLCSLQPGYMVRQARKVSLFFKGLVGK